ncbi:MAG: hypothetical protein JST80_05480 [Bdellovibrionales bacterium]|nr:hypothetical protein [Bdellovibrionales bacterium]
MSRKLKTPSNKKASTSRSSKNSDSKKSPARAEQIHCYDCKNIIEARDQALFVEEEVGRYFCSEGCIVAHFTPDIEKLEREYGRHVSAQDLSPEERERFAHLRWLTLEQPGEVWVEKTKAGDHRYTLVAEYRPEEGTGPKKVWGVAVCLMLRQEPSFLYLAFVTGDRDLVDVFRRGEQLQIIRRDEPKPHLQDGGGTGNDETELESTNETPEGIDRLADSWTEADSVRAQIIKQRKDNDIPFEDFGFYQNCLEETLQEPSELWSFLPKAAKRVYHFIRRYEHDASYWYVVIARDTSDETQIEIVDAFPTNDETLVQACRHGKKEALNGQTEEADDHGFAATGTDGKKNVH